MKRYLTIALVVLLGSMALASCQRKYKAEAGGEEDANTYQPLPAPNPSLKPGELMIGEIRKVDIGNMMMIVRLENGMDQTLKLADDTRVVVTAVDPKGVPINLRQLSTFYRAGVSIQWREEDGSRVATSIDVTQEARQRHRRRR